MERTSIPPLREIEVLSQITCFIEIYSAENFKNIMRATISGLSNPSGNDSASMASSGIRYSRNGFTEKTLEYVVEKTFESRYTPHFNFLAGIGSAGMTCASRGMELPATCQT